MQELDTLTFNDELQVAAPFLAVEMIMTTGNTQIKNLNFGEALAHLKTGYCVSRDGWNGKGMFLVLIQGSNTLASALKIGYGEYLNEPTLADTVFMKTADNKLVAWLCSQSDMLAEDWVVLAK